MAESKEPRYLQELGPAYLGALDTALVEKNSAEASRLETALSDLYDVHRASTTKSFMQTRAVAAGVEYDPSKPFFAQALQIVAPAVGQSLMAEVKEQILYANEVSAIQAEELRH